MGYFRTEITPNSVYDENDKSLSVKTTYTEEVDHPSTDTLKKTITRGIFHTNVQLTSYDVLTVTSYLTYIGIYSGIQQQPLPFEIGIMGMIGIQHLMGNRHSELKKHREKLTSQGYALDRFTGRSESIYHIIKPGIKDFLSTFRRNP